MATDTQLAAVTVTGIATKSGLPPTLAGSTAKVTANLRDPAMVGKWWRPGWRHQGQAYNDPYNLDMNPAVYGGVSKVNQLDGRAADKFSRPLELAAGVNNLTAQPAHQSHPQTRPHALRRAARPEVKAPAMNTASSASSSALQRLFWRLHFWAGLTSAPIILFAALTGLLYVFTPQIEAWRHADVDTVAPPAPGAPRLPLDAQVAAARAAAPDAALRYVVPAHDAADSTQVWLGAAHEHHGMSKARGGDHDHGLPTGSVVYVNPYTGQVLGQLAEMDRLKTWAKKLHASALQGNGWRWLMELGASWMLVLFATGLVMWWPRSQAAGGDGWQALRPRWGRGRTTWRDLHAVTALVTGLVMAVVLVTGLTWAQHSGERFKALQRGLGQEAPRAPKTLKSAPGEAPHLSWQTAYEMARAQVPDIAMQITPPMDADGVWRIENFDRSQPTVRFSLALDARTGTPLFRSGWSDFPALARATAAGIPFHRGEFGVWNQVLLALAALAAIFSVISGFVMWWQRRPRGKLAAPRLASRHLKQVPLWLWPLMAGLAWALPVFGWSLLAFIAAEALARLLKPAIAGETGATK